MIDSVVLELFQIFSLSESSTLQGCLQLAVTQTQDFQMSMQNTVMRLPFCLPVFNHGK